jgi:hypothetical protein
MRIIFTLLLCASFNALADPNVRCTFIDGTYPKEFSHLFVPAEQVVPSVQTQHIAMLKEVFFNLTSASNYGAGLFVCTGMGRNAFAKFLDDYPTIQIDISLLDLIKWQKDAVAALMGHELAHLILKHADMRRGAVDKILQTANVRANRSIRRGQSKDEAIKQGVDFFVLSAMKFSRELEQQADDKGFSIAFTLAKYNPEGAKNITLALMQLPEVDSIYLKSHPSAKERYAKAADLTENQTYLNEASELLNAKKWTLLKQHSLRWIASVPNSGAAWYYYGRALSRLSKHGTQLTMAYENSVENYLFSPSLGTVAQEDQTEKDIAWLNLCVALYDEGYRYESLNCYKRIRQESNQQRYRQVTKQSVIVAAGYEPLMSEDIWIGRDDSGAKLITNDRVLAQDKSANKVPPAWRAPRTGKLAVKDK